VATNVYIVPLWKFFAGDIAHPLDSFGIDVSTIRVGWRQAWVEKRQRKTTAKAHALGRQRASEFVDAVATQLGRSISWLDEGDCIECNQFHYGDQLNHWWRWWPLREQLPEYDTDTRWEKDFIPGHKRMSEVGDSATPEFPEVYGLGYIHTFALPVEFSGHVQIWPVKQFWGMTWTRVYSIPSALRDVERSIELLRATNCYAKTHEPKGFGQPADGMTHLRKLLLKAQAHSLPLIFD